MAKSEVEYTNLEAEAASFWCQVLSTAGHSQCDVWRCGCECHIRGGCTDTARWRKKRGHPCPKSGLEPRR